MTLANRVCPEVGSWGMDGGENFFFLKVNHENKTEPFLLLPSLPLLWGLGWRLFCCRGLYNTHSCFPPMAWYSMNDCYCSALRCVDRVLKGLMVG